MEKVVSDKDLKNLRASGLITNEETAYIIGDQIVAENLLNKERRILQAAGLILESSKGLLKG